MKKILKIALFFILGMLGGFFLGDITASIINKINPIVLIIAFILSIFLHLIIHEGGHLSAGLLTGYKFSSFRIGSIILYKRLGKFYFGKFNIAGTGGQCLLVPPPIVNGKYPFMFYNAGGGLLNILASIFAYKGFYDLQQTWPVVATILAEFALIGMFVGISNLFPMKVSGMANDGYNMLSAIKNPEHSKNLWIQLEVNRLQYDGVRLKDMPDEWFDYKIGDIDVMNQSIGMLSVSRFCDKGDYVEASELGNKIINTKGTMAIASNEIKCGLLFIYSLDEKLHDEARKLFNDKSMMKYFKATKNYVARKSMLYAYYSLVEKDMKKASLEKEAYNKLSKSYPNLAEIESEGEAIAFIDELLKM